MQRLSGKVAIVVGGAGGIGRVFAKGLTGEGARVVVADADEAAARAVADDLAREGRECLALRVDVRSEESTQSMMQQTLERFGRIDVLINAAAIYATLDRKAFLDIDLKEWELVMDVNFTGSALCAKAVLPAMKQQRSGVIVNMASVNTQIAPEGRAHYSAGKAAIENLTKTLARELGPFGIRVNALSPGLVRTGRAPNVPEERYERVARERALRRDLTPDDLIGPLVFLCSDDAAMVTGHVLVVDGGQVFV